MASVIPLSHNFAVLCFNSSHFGQGVWVVFDARGLIYLFFSINASKIYFSPRQQRPDISAGTLNTKSPATCRGEVGEGVQPDLKEKINLVLLFEFWFPLVRFGGQG